VKLIHNGNDSSFTVITSTASGGGAFLSVVDSSFGSSLQEERKRLAAKQASVRSLIMMDPFSDQWSYPHGCRKSLVCKDSLIVTLRKTSDN
jgi:hypothetical protein